jgi:tungstate transport system ATP-binding protein
VVALGIIQLSDIEVRYGDIRALRGVTIDIQSGEIVTLIGPNGAGKTTLLKVMAGLITQYDGQMQFMGETITNANRAMVREHATLVFQKPVQFGTTVFKNLAYGLRIRGLAESDVHKRVRQSLKLVGLEGFEDRSARRLSGGEKRRVSLARAVAIEPSVLLLDEPSADLDPESKQIVEEVLRTLNKDLDMTIVLATHDIFRAKALADCIGAVRDGIIERYGSASSIFKVELESQVGGVVETNSFQGHASRLETRTIGWSVLRVDLGNGVSVDAMGNQEGDVTLIIPPEDVIVSTDVILSSARNSLKGKISRVESIDSAVFVTIDVGIEILAQITLASLKRLRIKVGDKVYVTFKASSAIVY